MPYTNAIFYVDMVSGNDGARTGRAFTLSNPGGSTVRVTTTVAHGLATGAVVDITGTTNFNSDWKITYVSATEYDLDAAFWSPYGTLTGTATPRGGGAWADAWASINGATAARTQPGDEIRFAKTADPVSIGSATWTQGGTTITITNPPLLMIDECESGWTAVNSATISANSTRKNGSFSQLFSKTTPLTANTRYAYKTLPSALNLSSYNAVTLWIRSNNSQYWLTDDAFKLCLCSDSTGTTVVDEFLALGFGSSFANGSYYLGAAFWYPVTLTRTGGGSLGSNINSIAIYSSTTTNPYVNGFLIDTIMACNKDSLSLTSMIGTTAAAVIDSSADWYTLSNITLTTPTSATLTISSLTGGFVEPTNTYTTYARPVYQRQRFAGMSETQYYLSWHYPNRFAAAEPGTALSRISYKFGYNTNTNIQDGSTAVFGSFSAWFLVASFINISNLIISNSAGALKFNNVDGVNVDNCLFTCGDTIFQAPESHSAILFLQFGNGTQGVRGANFRNTVFSNWNKYHGRDRSNLPYPGRVLFSSCKFTNSSDTTGVILTFKDYEFVNCVFRANSGRAILIGGPVTSDALAVGCTFTTSIASNESAWDAATKDCTYLGVTELETPTGGSNCRLMSQNHDLTGYTYGVTDGGTFNDEPTDRPLTSGRMWRLVLTNNTRTFFYPLNLAVGQFACAANAAVTVSAWMRKSHATNCDGRLRVRAYQLAGVTSDVVATLANNTSWQQLSITFTPTEAGVFEVDALAEYVAGNANVYIDEIEVTQA